MSVDDDDLRYLPIGDYALLSDCHSTALVSAEGSIDWACLRRMDRGSAFARILDYDHGGHFSIRPVEPIVERSRRYVPATMVLETTMSTASGTVVVTDAFAMREGGAQHPRSQMIRTVRATDGAVEIEIVLAPVFDYGLTRPWIRSDGGERILVIGGDDALVVDADIDLEMDRHRSRITGRHTVRPDAPIAITMVSQAAHLLDDQAADCSAVDELLRETIEWWEHWSESTTAEGEYADLVERSALVLKSLNCAPTGAIIAAPTTSLPEVVGGGANWDYRYCWVRDATLALEALVDVGHNEMSQGLRDFLMRSAAGHGDELQIMFGCYGERRLPEQELDLEGWRGSSPVRIGNGAATQTQLDVFGHLLDAAHIWNGRATSANLASGIRSATEGEIDDEEWRFLVSVVDRAVACRNDKDAGIWELRGPAQHYVHSKAMLWLALECGISLVENHGRHHDHVDQWRDARREIREKVDEHGVDPTGRHFVQHFGTTDVDASLLKLPLVGFVDANDERMLATVDVIVDQLAVPPLGFLQRFRSDEGSNSGGMRTLTGEGTFLLCSFWLVEVLSLQGRRAEAVQLFERLVDVGNDVGLFAEEYDVVGGELLGNFPQAFTHLGIISAARRLRLDDPAR